MEGLYRFLHSVHENFKLWLVDYKIVPSGLGLLIFVSSVPSYVESELVYIDNRIQQI